MLIRAAFGYLPMAFILAGVAIAATGLLVAITDDISARRRQRPRHRAVRQPAAGGRRRIQERARRELGHPAVRRLPRRDHPRDRRVRALARDDHPRRRDLHLRLLPPPHLRRDDLARDEPLGTTARRAARRDHPRQVRHRLDPHASPPRRSPTPTSRTATGSTFEQMLAGAALLVLAAWSPFALLRMIPMMEVAAASVGEPALVDVSAQPDRPASTAPPPTCDRRWIGTRGRRRHRRSGDRPAANDIRQPSRAGRLVGGRRGARHRLRRRRRPASEAWRRSGHGPNRITGVLRRHD